MQTIIGRHYNVLCVFANIRGRMMWLPILGGWHPDPELGNPRPHYHLDYRFVPPVLLQRLLAYDGGFRASNIQVIPAWAGDLPTKDRRLRCYRQFEPIISSTSHCGHINETDWMVFEELLSKSEVQIKNNCHYCPHKGVQLDGAPIIGGKAVECPGHGLCWDLSTGKMFRRALPLSGN